MLEERPHWPTLPVQFETIDTTTAAFAARRDLPRSMQRQRPRSLEESSHHPRLGQPGWSAAPPFQPPTSTALWTSGSQAVLLQTARALVYNPDEPQRFKHIRIVLDSGSQRSYVTEQLKMDLGLKQKGEQSMSIMTFGSRDESSRVCEVVNVGMEVRGGHANEAANSTQCN